MATNNSNIASKLQAVNNNISASAAAYNRDINSIQLLAVSKTKPVSDIVTAYEAQHRHFGENYVQEAVDKIQQLKDLSQLCWHFIGPLQSNKSKFIAEYFDWMHSLDRLKIAKRLNEQRSVHQKPLQVCVQVNIDDENSKAGIAPNEVLAFVEQLQSLEKIQCRGLMTIPKAGVSATEREASFAQMQQLFTQCQEKFPNFDTLSMGMSDDMDLAIKYGATIVRIGTGIFGSRN